MWPLWPCSLHWVNGSVAEDEKRDHIGSISRLPHVADMW